MVTYAAIGVVAAGALYLWVRAEAWQARCEQAEKRADRFMAESASYQIRLQNANHLLRLSPDERMLEANRVRHYYRSVN